MAGSSVGGGSGVAVTTGAGTVVGGRVGAGVAGGLAVVHPAMMIRNARAAIARTTAGLAPGLYGVLSMGLFFIKFPVLMIAGEGFIIAEPFGYPLPAGGRGERAAHYPVIIVMYHGASARMSNA
jgi:hypothetical protein